MHHILNLGESALPPVSTTSTLFFIRILIGLLQGALLVLLHAANMANIWPATAMMAPAPDWFVNVQMPRS